MSFEPKDPNYDARVRASFARQVAMASLAIEVVDVRPGAIELRMPYAAGFAQQHGFVHAGIIATALDSACGYAAFSLMSEEAGVVTVEFKINLLAPAKGDYFLLRAQVVRPGRTLSFCDGQALAVTAGEEKLVATMSATLMAVVGREDIRG